VLQRPAGAADVTPVTRTDIVVGVFLGLWLFLLSLVAVAALVALATYDIVNYL